MPIDEDPTCPMCSERVVDRALAGTAGWCLFFVSLALWIIDHRLVTAVLWWLNETLTNGCAP